VIGSPKLWLAMVIFAAAEVAAVAAVAEVGVDADP
jgi:hypothetical protein